MTNELTNLALFAKVVGKALLVTGIGPGIMIVLLWEAFYSRRKVQTQAEIIPIEQYRSGQMGKVSA